MKKYIVLVLLMVFVPISAVIAEPVQWYTSDGGNGHYYERFDASVTWDQAREAANAMTYDTGTEILQGHLVTITTLEENLFLTYNSDLGGGESNNWLHYRWMGGYQPAGSSEPGGGWSWVTGEDFDYANWGGEYFKDDETGEIFFVQYEPNNSFGTENRIVFDGGFLTDGKSWNDLTGTWSAAGYIVEYDGLPDIAVIPTVPEPATLLLLGFSLMGLVPMRKKLLK